MYKVSATNANTKTKQDRAVREALKTRLLARFGVRLTMRRL